MRISKSVPILALAVLAGLLLGIPGVATGRPRAVEIRAIFSPDGGAEKAIVAELRSARRSIDAALYLLTSPPLADELVAAHQRGVAVRIVLDGPMTRRWSRLPDLIEARVPVWLVTLVREEGDPTAPQFHHKFAVLDGRVVLTGSFNWTVAADERNHENLVVIEDRTLAAEFTKVFEEALPLGEKQGERDD